MQLTGKVGFLGCGNMGFAILRGLIQQGTAAAPGQALFYEPDAGRSDEARSAGGEAVESPEELARRSDVLILAVKPQVMGDALEPLRRLDGVKALVISIAAGISIRFIRERLGADTRVARVMPNTPALVGAGAAGYAMGPGCSQADEEAVRAIFESVGMAERVREEDLDAVTALSGSGPAYFFYLVECMAQAAQAQGIERGQAYRLAGQTLAGASALLAGSGEAPETLRARVTSKGGTTEAAINALAARGFDDMVRAAIDAAASRSRELGQ